MKLICLKQGRKKIKSRQMWRPRPRKKIEPVILQCNFRPVFILIPAGFKYNKTTELPITSVEKQLKGISI